MTWLRRLFHKSRAESELDKELRFHLERQIADYVAAGTSPEQARRRARLEFGGIDRVKEEVRDTRWEFHLEDLFRDLRYALRSLCKERRFALVAIFALALGIGALSRPQRNRKVGDSKLIELKKYFEWSLELTSE